MQLDVTVDADIAAAVEKLGTMKAADFLKVAADPTAVRDIAPRAPTHILVVPRDHIPSAAELTDNDGPILGHLFAVAAQIATSRQTYRRRLALAMTARSAAVSSWRRMIDPPPRAVAGSTFIACPLWPTRPVQRKSTARG